MSVAKALLCGLTGILLLVFVCVALLIKDPSPDPFDRFEVLELVSDSRLQQHAVMYRYYHANSSGTFTAIWILSGKAPTVGSTSPVGGSPVLIWTGRPQALQLTWRQLEGRFLVEVQDPADIWDDRYAACYFEDRTNMLCMQSKQIDVRASPAARNPG